MPQVTHFFPSCGLALAAKQVNLTSDTLQVLLVASGAYTWNATALAAVHVSDFLAGSGAGALTEVSTGGGSNYTRQALSVVSVADTIAAPAGYTTLTVSNNPSWASATFATSYACFFDSTVGGTDATNQLICYTDFGGVQAVTAAAPFTLPLGSVNGVAQALVQWQSA